MGLAGTRHMGGRGAGAFLPCVPLLLLVLLAGGCAVARPSDSGGTGRAPVVAPVTATPAATATTPGDTRMGMTTPRLPDGMLVTVSKTGEIRTLDPADAARQALRHDYILLGESHTSACDHRAQAAFIATMLAEGARPAIGLEMVPRDGQPALDEFSRGATPLAKLPDALDWGKTWGYDFELYKPVFAVADWARLPVHGLNVPQRVVRQVSRGGLESVAEADRAWLPPSIIAPAPEQRATLTAIFREHAAMRAGRAGQGAAQGQQPQVGQTALAGQQPAAPTTATGVSPAAPTVPAAPAAPPATPSPAPSAPPSVPMGSTDEALERFLLVQSLWDSGMAHQAVRVRVAHGGPVVILAGGGHVEFGWGIARRIRLLDPDARVLLVMPWRIAPDAEGASPAAAGNKPAAAADAPPDGAQADLFWVCRAEPEPPRPMPGMPVMPDGGGPARPRLGLLLQQEADGARVQQVEPGSVAERAGFRPGDLILRVGDRVVDSMRVLHEAGAAAVAAGQDVRFTVRGPGDADGERVLTVPGLK